MQLIDAYAHVGEPRFGTAAQAAAFLQTVGVERMALVLFPGSPDLDGIDQAHALLGSRVRVFGMPYGSSEAEVVEIAEAQLDAGVVGLRIDNRELTAYPALLDLLGSRTAVIYATNPVAAPGNCGRLAEWLDRYPGCAVAAPHFLNLTVPPAGSKLREELERLTGHPRFAAIFSRQGGMGSALAYPHEDFRPWVEYVVDRCGWHRIMFGSEYPVLFWRNERYDECRDWLETLLPGAFEGTGGDKRRHAYLGGNAERFVFGRTLPPRSPVRKPAWLAGRFDPNGPVTIFPKGFTLPMTVYSDYLAGYLEVCGRAGSLRSPTFEQYLAVCLGRGRDACRRRAGRPRGGARS